MIDFDTAISLNFSKEDLTLLSKVAQIKRIPRSSFIRSVSIAEAKEILKEEAVA